jgi:diaminopimelate decarboxylase
MSHFNQHKGELHAEALAVADLARRYGTPCYIYSRAAFTQHYLAYAEALRGFDHLVCYAVKANSNLAVLNVLAKLGAGFDIVSGGELDRVIAAGGDPAKVVFSGVAKTASEMRHALQLGIHCFNLESAAELERLNTVAGELGKVASVSLRVNPDVDANTHPYISTGLQENKFGIDIEEAVSVYKRAASLPHIRVIGVDCHIGSQLTELAPFLAALDRVIHLIDTLKEAGINIEHLDMGGGLGVCYVDETPPTPAQYIEALTARLAGRALKLIIEPGRSIAANAGILVTRVEYLKSNGDKHFAIVDAAMNDMIRPALYQAWMNIIPVCERSQGKRKSYDIVGPVCETGDFLGKDRPLIIEQNDLLAVCGSGAYGFTMSSNYNSRGRAAEIMVDGDKSYIVRQRETSADLIRGESLLPL